MAGTMVRVLAVATLGASAVACVRADHAARADLGRSAKLRILVDKVMQPEAGWVTRRWMVREAAQAGFNVFSPRIGYDRLDDVRKVTTWCGHEGIYHMPWMRGTLDAPEGPEADGKRMVWGSGDEQALWSPNSDELWEWMTRYIIEYAKISAADEHLMGVFLDYENYAPGRGGGNCYDLSYDDLILGEFAQAKGTELPKLPLEVRKSWLEQKGLYDEFAEFQIAHWRERCRALRKAVDAINPKFQFCVYPAPGTPFMVKAIYPEWATGQAPLILADAGTYGRPGRLLPQRKALERNREILVQGMQVARDAGIPFMYTGGIDPVVGGADPEFSGENAVMISEATDGYWVFYEGPTYTGTHREYFRWFTWANNAISEGRFAAWRERRETPDASALPAFTPIEKSKAKTVEYPVVRLRGPNLLLVGGRAGQPFEVTLRHEKVASYVADVEWELMTADWDSLATGTIPHGQQGTIRHTPNADGLYLISVTAGACAYSVASSTAPLAIYAGDGVSLVYGAERLYFRVPAGVQAFTVGAEGPSGETVRLTVYDPKGGRVATDQTTMTRDKAQIEVAAAEHPGRVWSLTLTQADEGVLEDCTLHLDPKLPPAVSLVAEEAFGVEGEP